MLSIYFFKQMFYVEKSISGLEVLPSFCVGLLSPSSSVYHRVPEHAVAAAAATPAVFLLCVGGAAEHLTDRLSDGVAVDAKESEQLVGLTTPWYLRHCQAVDGEASLIHHC